MKHKIQIFIILFFICVALTACSVSEITLSTPTGLTFNESTHILSWDKVFNAVRYEVNISSENEEIDTIITSETSIKIEYGGELTVKVRALGDNNVRKHSTYSEPLIIKNIVNLTPIEDYKLVLNDHNLNIVFDTIKGSDKYDFELFNELGESVGTNTNIIAIDGKVNIEFSDIEIGKFELVYTIYSGDKYRSDLIDAKLEFNINDFSFKSSSTNYDKASYDKLNILINFGNATISSLKIEDTLVTDYEIGDGTIILPCEILHSFDVGNLTIQASSQFSTQTMDLILCDNREIFCNGASFNYNLSSSDPLVFNLLTYTKNLESIKITHGGSDVLTLTSSDYTYDNNQLSINSSVFDSFVAGEYVITLTASGSDYNVGLNLFTDTNNKPYVSVINSVYDMMNKDPSATISFEFKNINPYSGTYFASEDYGSGAHKYMLLNNDLLTPDKDFYLDNQYSVSHKASSTIFTLDNEYLSSLKCGEYTFFIRTSIGGFIYKLNVVNSKAEPYNARVEMLGDGTPVLAWDYDKSAPNFSLIVDGEEHNTTDNYLPLSQLSTENIFDVTIADIYSRALPVTFTVNASHAIEGNVNYAQLTYEFMGEENDFIISDSEELVDFIEYLFFTRPTHSLKFCLSNAMSSSSWEKIKTVAINRVQEEMSSLINGISINWSFDNEEAIKYITISLSYSTKIDYNAQPTLTSGAKGQLNNEITAPCYVWEQNERVYAIDSISKTQLVSTSSQLYFAVEKGVRPIPERYSDADRIYEKAKYILSNIITDEMDEYTKIHYIYDWLVCNVTYDSNANNLIATLPAAELWKYDMFYLEGVFDDNVAVCDGIAKAFTLMCRIEGIETIKVSGLTSSKQNHAWNKVTIDGKTYCIDATWGDKVYSGIEYLSHEYLLINDSDIFDVHFEDNLKLFSTENFDFYDKSSDDRFYTAHNTTELNNIVSSHISDDYAIEIKLAFNPAITQLSQACPTGGEYKLFNQTVIYYLLPVYTEPTVEKKNISYDKADGEDLTITVNFTSESDYYEPQNMIVNGIEEKIAYYLLNNDLTTEDVDFYNGNQYTMSYNDSITTFVIKSEYLSTLPVGDYVFAINNKINMPLVNVTISDSSKGPEEVYIEYVGDVPYLCWEYYRSEYFTITVNNTYSRQTTEFKVPLSEIGMTELNTTYSVKIELENGGYTTRNITYRNYVVGSVDYKKEEYTFNGESHNKVISSCAELCNMFEYCMFTRQTEISVYFNIPNNGSDDIKTITNKAFAAAAANLGKIASCVLLSYSGNTTILNYTFDYSATQSEPTSATSQTFRDQDEALAPCYTLSNYSRTFAIDTLPLSSSVSTTEQLLYAVENGYRPNVVAGTRAASVYQRAKNALSTIINDSMSEMTKVHYIYDWLTVNVTYDRAACDLYLANPDNSSLNEYYAFYLEGVFGFVDGTSSYGGGIAVCDGISKAFLLMCAIEGIDVERIIGNSRGVGHAWNKVTIDGVRYSVDATWGDMGVNFSSGQRDFTIHYYLLRNDIVFFKDHVEDNISDFSVDQLFDVYDSVTTDCFYTANSQSEFDVLLTGMVKGEAKEIRRNYDYEAFNTPGYSYFECNETIVVIKA